MAESTMDELLAELKKDVQAKMLDRMLRDEDLSRYDKPLKKALKEAVDALLDGKVQKDQWGHALVHPIAAAASDAVEQWAKDRVKKLLEDPKRQAALNEELAAAVDDALRDYAKRVRFYTNVDTR